MAGVGRTGPEPLADKRELFARLIREGDSNSEACRKVGVNRRTGTRWRFGRTIPASCGRVLHYPPVISPRLQVISPRYLSEDERVMISDLHRAGTSVRVIAADLGRNPSTVSRELRRNRSATGRYGASDAHRQAALRRCRPRARRVAVDLELRQFVQSCLECGWSPEQISHALQEKFPSDPRRQLVHESIYQALYSADAAVHRTLGKRRRRRRPRRRPDARRPGGMATPMVLIDQRPDSVEDRVEPGHWEGDLIMGVGNRSAIGTLVERTSRNVVLLHLPNGRTAAEVRDALIDVFATLPPNLRRSLTWDQGKEMSAHSELTLAVDMPVYFCHRSSPWERGSNENMNGLLRDYFPKRTDLRVHTADDLAAVAAQLNQRPRKTLDWKTPAELFATLQREASLRIAGTRASAREGQREPAGR